MSLSPAMNTALAGSSVTIFDAVQIILPNQTINLITASGYVTFSVNGVMTTFEGLDPVFGSLAGVDPRGSQMGNETPRCSITLNPPTNEAVGVLCDPSVQGAKVRAYVGVVDQATGLVVGTPYQNWSGMLDVAYSVTDGQSFSVELDTVSILAKFLMKKEARRLTPAWQATHFPGSRGLAFNVAATETPVWGSEGVSGTGANGGTTFGGNVGGGGGAGGIPELGIFDIRNRF